MMTRTFQVTLLGMTLLCGTIVQAQKPMGKLLEFGWDMPDVPFIHQNAQKMEAMPFDGFITDLGRRNATPGVERQGGLAWSFWQSEPITDDLKKRIESDIKLLAQTKFKRMDQIFLQVNAHPGGVDWFDEKGFENVLSNWRLIAKAVKQTGFRGIFFDNEYYAKRPGPAWRPCIWQYDVQPQHDKHSFIEYQAQVTKRAKAIMRILKEECPGTTVIFPFADSLLAKADKASYPTHRYGMFSAFLDGFLTESDGKITIVDGYEGAYTFRNEDQFKEAREFIMGKSAEISNVPDQYRKQMKVGFGLFIDLVSKMEFHTNPADFHKNAYTPKELTYTVHSGLKNAQYVWIYSQKINWWTGENRPDAYVQALVRAKLPQDPPKTADRPMKPGVDGPLD